MYGSGTTEFTKAAIGIAHPATAAATTSLPIRRDGWLGPPICQPLLFRSSPAPVDAFPQSSRLTRPSEAAGCGIGDPGVGNDSGAVSRAIRPADPAGGFYDAAVLWSRRRRSPQRSSLLGSGSKIRAFGSDSTSDFGPQR